MTGQGSPSKIDYETVDGVDAWEPPNIIFVMLDDLGYADVGCYGGELIRTPTIDWMAEEGTRFTQCYTGSPVCAPARSVLLTGQHSGHTRVRHNHADVGGARIDDSGWLRKTVPLQPADVTVAELLSEGGYVTGATGKWGLGDASTTGMPTRNGFDEWFGYLDQVHAHNYYPPFLYRNEEKQYLEGNHGDAQMQYSHDLFAEFALDFVRDHADERFFLYLPFTIPHGPMVVPELEPYVDDSWSADEQARASMITRLDRDLGRLFDLLAELGIDGETIVFFCSDHGVDRTVAESRFDSNGPFRGIKREVYEGGIRTPMIVRWPGQVPAGEIDDTPWYYPDVLPTCAELAGLPFPTGTDLVVETDGVSVVPTLLGEEQDLADRYLYWEFPSDDGFQQAARIRDWKAVRPDIGTPIELYDLAEDEGEEHDVADDHPEIVERVKVYLEHAHEESKHWPIGVQKHF